MSKVKFRVWDKELECYLNPEYFYITGEGRGFTCEHSKGMYSARYEYMGTSRFIIERYTGLKDKNGVEIYEGGVVKYTFRDDDSAAGREYEQNFAIEWDGNFCCFRLNDSQYRPLGSHQGKWSMTYLKNLVETTEAIGNIHEKPKLLKT